MPPILVAGATGTNGSELVRQLADRGIAVRALVRDPQRAEALAGPHVELAIGDLARPDTLDAAMSGVERAYIVSAIHPDSVQWFGNFFAAAKRAAVRHVVKFSGIGASADSGSRIIRQHYESDQHLIDSGLGYTILRPNSFYQNMLWQAESIKKTGTFYLAAGDAQQSMVDVRDIAAATVAILGTDKHLNRIYDLTGPESLSYHDVAKKLTQAIGRDVTYQPVPAHAARQSMLDSGLPPWHADALAEIQGVFATGLYEPVYPDLADLLDRPPITFDDFAREHAAAFR